MSAAGMIEHRPAQAGIRRQPVPVMSALPRLLLVARPVEASGARAGTAVIPEAVVPLEQKEQRALRAVFPCLSAEAVPESTAPLGAQGSRDMAEAVAARSRSWLLAKSLLMARSTHLEAAVKELPESLVVVAVVVPAV
jgi:hypothetical protein